MIKSLKIHKMWWLSLVVTSIVISEYVNIDSGIAGIIGGAVGIMLWAIILAGLPQLFYYLIKSPLTPIQYMWTLTTTWLFVSGSNLVVFFSGV